MNVAIIGASDKPHRYSYMALQRLRAAGHNVYPVHKVHKEIEGVKVYNSISDIKEQIDTVTLYVNSEVSDSLANEILALRPRRIIFNPGAENYSLRDLAEKQGIDTVFACTLVLLSTGQF